MKNFLRVYLLMGDTLNSLIFSDVKNYASVTMESVM